MRVLYILKICPFFDFTNFAKIKVTEQTGISGLGTSAVFSSMIA